MDSYGFLNALFGLGFFGLFIAFVVWLILTTLTGYIFGIGVWAAMPSEIKAIVRAKVQTIHTPDTP